MEWQPQVYRNWSGGMNTSVSNFLLPPTVLRLLLNGHVDESNGNYLGNIQQRRGYTIVGSQLESGKDILGLTNYVSADGNTTRLVATVNDSGDTESQTQYYDPTLDDWFEIGAVPESWTAGSKMRFTTFLGRLYAANQDDAVKTWDGDPNNGWTTINAVDAPQGNLIVNFFDRVNIAGNSDFPSRLYYSSFPDSSGNITWSDNYLEINPDDNDQITALAVLSSHLVVFKRFGLYTWTGLATSADRVIDVGTVSQESVATLRGLVYFFGVTKDSCAIYEYRGEWPVEISRPIRSWLEAIDQTEYDNVAAFADEDNVYFSVGDVTHDGTTYSNVLLRYTASKQVWVVYATADRVRFGIDRVDNNGNRSIVIGDDNGQVHTWGSGDTDNGTAIEVRIRTKELEAPSRYMTKTHSKMVVYSPKPQGASVKVRVDNTRWETIGRLQKPFEVIEHNAKGRWHEYEVALVNSEDQFVFDGFEIIDGYIEDYVI